MKSGIYAIVNMKSGSRYIGRSVDLDKRRKMHWWQLENNRHFNKPLQAAYNKGDPLVFTVVEKCGKDKLNEREVYWIEYFDSLENGYNLCEGGKTTTGYHFTDEQKKKISDAKKGRVVQRSTIEKRERTKRIKYETDAEYRRTVQENGRKALKIARETQKGKPFTKEHREKLSHALKGRYISQRHKEKLRRLYSGEGSKTVKLKRSDIVSIRYRFLSGERQFEIRKDYPQITAQTIYDIVHNRRWKSVPCTLDELMKEVI